MKRLKLCALALALTALGTTTMGWADDSDDNDDDQNATRIQTLSTPSHLVTGGDVLVRVNAPRGAALSTMRVKLNGADVTGVFRADAATRSLTGLVKGLALGSNIIEAYESRNGGRGEDTKRLVVTNYPITGPIISGPHEVPFICQTTQFALPTTGGNLGAPLDANCSIATRVDYVYSANGTSFKPLDAAAAVPADVVNTTTNTGATVRFIVRVETGTVNRAIYQIAMLHDPYLEPAPNWYTPSAGWNRKLIYQHGGGCQGGWYIQGGSTGGVLTASHLGRGFARASSSLNVFGNNCNDLLASETTLMVKERFVESYGVPKWTIGTGSSGGAYQSNQTADAYPGTFDGIVTMSSFPDVTTGVITLHDSRLLDVLFNTTLPGVYSADKQRAISGYRQVNEIVFLSRSSGTSALRLDPTQSWNAAVPTSLRYSTANPNGARATVYDHTVNVYGESANGFARRPLDNVGVQYGFKALNDGAITVAEFLQVNELIGGVDIDFKNTPQRTVADPGTMKRAYASGRVLNGGGGLKNIPIITQHGAGDPAVGGDIHLKFYSWSIRQRLIEQNGHADNQIITAPFNVRDDYFEQMNRWLDAVWADSSAKSLSKKVVANKPADVVDACWDSTGTKIVETLATPWSPGTCNTLYPASYSPNLVAGAPIEASTIKCKLNKPRASDYAVAFTAAEWTKLNRVFPDGVCDWRKTGVEQTSELKTWASFGPSPKNLIFDITK